MKGTINAVAAIRRTGGSRGPRAYYHRIMRTHFARSLPLAVAALCLAGGAQAAGYPVGGNWTYEHASENGPAKSCGKRHMRFDGQLRYDTGSGAPEYKNISAIQNGPQSWRVVDEFFTGVIRGRVTYMLRVTDPDHLELHFDRGASTTRLRRCP